MHFHRVKYQVFKIIGTIFIFIKLLKKVFRVVNIT